jgi:RND family efflux transporter MFP subunit
MPSLRFPLSCAPLLLVACSGSAPPPAAPPPPEVTVALPLDREITEWDEFTGRLVAAESVELRARVSGYLASVGFEEGELVEPGELLMVIDRRPFEAALQRARAEVAAARARLELAASEEQRAGELARERLVSAQELDNRRQRRAEATAQLAAAEAWERAAGLDLEFCEIRAPIAGRIGRRLVTGGNLVRGGENESTLLATIVSLDPIHVYVSADEQVYLRFLRGARAGTRPSLRENRIPARLRLADEAGWPHEGYVDFVDNQIDAATGTIQGRAVFANPDGVLTPGLFGVMQVRGVGPYRALLVPDIALASDLARRIVWVVGEDDVPVAREVTPGRLVGTLRVITGGLAPDDRVVINGMARIRPGQPVRPVAGEIEVPAELAAVGRRD